MKKLLALVLAVILATAAVRANVFDRFRSFEPQASAATGAIFEGSGRRFHCSGTEIGKTNDGGGIFLTARHCVANHETNALYEKLVVSFSANQGGPFYDATPVAISLTDDLALLYLKNGADIPEVKIKDERRLRSGASIFNVSFPLGTGKGVFHGEYMSPRFPFFPVDAKEEVPQWSYGMPMNLTIAHGSSGSGVFSNKERALIGVAVGTFNEGSYNIAIPSDRVLDFLFDLQDNTVEKFKYAFPEKEAPMMGGF